MATAAFPTNDRVGHFVSLPMARAIVTATSASVRFCKAHTLGLPAKTKRVKPANGRPLSERRAALFWLRSKLDKWRSSGIGDWAHTQEWRTFCFFHVVHFAAIV